MEKKIEELDFAKLMVEYAFLCEEVQLKTIKLNQIREELVKRHPILEELDEFERLNVVEIKRK